MRRYTFDLIDGDEALVLLGMQPRNADNRRAWQRRRAILKNTGLTAHPRGNVLRWSRKEVEALRRDLDSGRKSITACGHVSTLMLRAA